MYRFTNNVDSIFAELAANNSVITCVQQLTSHCMILAYIYIYIYIYI